MQRLTIAEGCPKDSFSVCFLIVAAIGVIAFVTVYPTASHAIDSLANYLNKQINTTF